MEIEKKGTQYIEKTIKDNNADFIKSIFIENCKTKFEQLYRCMAKEKYEIAKRFCTNNCIENLKDNKKNLNINDDFDVINVQSIDLVKYRKTEELEEIDAKMYVIFTDYKINNAENSSNNMNYSTEKYNITFRKINRK